MKQHPIHVFKKLILKQNKGLILLALFVLAEVTSLSLARYMGYNARMYDLGNMSQAIWSATQGEPLLFTTQGITVSRLSRHAELFYFLLAPLYAVWPTPKTLLIVQAVLYVSALWPLYALAKRRLSHQGMALSLGAMYLFYPVAQTAVLYDFHGDTLAMPLLIFTIEALDRKAWPWYWFWLGLSLSCKFYVAGPTAALGVIMWLKGDKKQGALTLLASLIWGISIFFIVRPLFAPAQAAEVQATVGSYVGYYFSDIRQLWASLPTRFLMGCIVYGPALWLGWRTPMWFLPASAIALPTLISDGPGPSYDYRYHHYALAVPFFLAAMVYGAEAARQYKEKTVALHVGVALIITFIFNSLFVNSPLNLRFYNAPPGSGEGLAPSSYGITPRDTFKDAWLADYVPPHIPIAADIVLSPHLTNRNILYLTRYNGDSAARTFPSYLDELDAVVVDALFDFALSNRGHLYAGGILYEQENIGLLLESSNFGLQQANDGLLLFKRGVKGLTQQVEILPLEGEIQAQFGESIALLEAHLDVLAQNHFRLTYQWVLLSPWQDEQAFVAISHPLGLENARIVHLPTYALRPPSTWPAEQIIQESFEFSLPPDTPPGTYPLQVGWYNANSVFAMYTDHQSRVGNLFEVGVLEVEAQ